MNTCIVGSRSLVLDGHLALHVLAAIQPLPHGAILLRKPLRRPARAFEGLVCDIALGLGFEVRWHAPGAGGRSQTFLRDVEMVQAADWVLAFFPEGDEMSGGTGHVVEKALDQQRPVFAYAIDGEKIRYIGSQEPEEAEIYSRP